MPKIWVGRTTLNGETKEDGLTNKEISQIIKQAVPEIQEEGDEIRFGSFNGKAFLLSVRLEIIDDETGQKVFCLQMQIKLKSCVTLFS